MAHGDYNCCAVCDDKLEYNPYDAKTKEYICFCCQVGLKENGVIVKSKKELIDWIKHTPAKIVVGLLKTVGYNRCYYENDVDAVVRDKEVEEAAE